MSSQPTFLIRQQMSGLSTLDRPRISEAERISILGQLDRIERRLQLGQDEFSDIGPVDTGTPAFTSPSDFDLPSSSYGALPYGEQPAAQPSTFWGDLFKVVTAAGGAAISIFKPTATAKPVYGPGGLVPKPVATTPTLAGIPWWGWLLGLGGLGAVGIGIAVLRR